MHEPYDWPLQSEWNAMTRAEKILRAQNLVNESDRRRSPDLDGRLLLSQAQRMASDLMKEADDDE